MYSIYMHNRVWRLRHTHYIIKKAIALKKSKYSVSPHISDTHMSFSPPPANASGGYTLI